MPVCSAGYVRDILYLSLVLCTICCRTTEFPGSPVARIADCYKGQILLQSLPTGSPLNISMLAAFVLRASLPYSKQRLLPRSRDVWRHSMSDPMRIHLSIFDEPCLDALSVCGKITPEEAGTLRELVGEDSTPLQDCEDSGGGPIWLQLISNWQKDPDGIHFHIDAARESSFGGKLPKRRDSVERIYDRFRIFAGKKMDFYVKARFVVERSELKKDSVINLLLGISVGPVDAEASLSGSTYKMKSGPVTGVRWNLGKRDGKEAVFAEVRSTDASLIGERIRTSRTIR